MSKPTPGKQYTIQDENTLSIVARRAYGNSAHWRRIWKANQSALRSGNPDLIYPGEVIFIPEIAELVPTPAPINRRPDELSIIIDGLEILPASARVLLTMDTASDGWTAVISPWIPGNNAELDKRLKPYSYPSAKVYIGGVLKITGYLYGVSLASGTDGTIATLEGFSKTADIIDSNLKPPYEESGVTLRQRANNLLQGHGIKAVFDADTGGPFDRITAAETDTIYEHLAGLARERGILTTSTPEGDLLFTEADTKSPSTCTLEEGKPPVLSFAATFNGRARFNVYRGINNSPSGANEGIAKDSRVPRSRTKTFTIPESLAGEMQSACKWERNKALADALTISLPVAGWLNPRTGKAWEYNTKVTVIAPSLFITRGFDMIIRSVEFSESDTEKTATLNVIPPQAYTKGEVKEPWE